MAPASPATLNFMRRYTAGFSGVHTLEAKWSSMADYLALFDRRCALNVACLVPNGNVRMEVMGLDTHLPTESELQQMGRLVREAMEQGAIGMSSGLDYIPSRYAETEELISLCREIAPFGGVYVTHMRSYTPQRVLESIDEVYRIGREAGVAVHISHFNTQAARALPKIDEGREELDVTYDLYCYLVGNTILGMAALPPWVQEGGIDATLDRLRDSAVLEQIRNDPHQTKAPVETIQLAFIAAEEYREHEGKTIGQAAADCGQSVHEFICRVLVASEMAVGCLTPHFQRTEKDIEELMRHPAMMGGSDGIFAGGYPHPRGWGCFARYLGYHVRERKTWTLEEAVMHLSSHPANRFGFQDRGLLREGMAADVVVFDSETITDHATFENGRQPASGVEHVVVNGEVVLHNKERTKALPGRVLRR